MAYERQSSHGREGSRHNRSSRPPTSHPNSSHQRAPTSGLFDDSYSPFSSSSNPSSRRRPSMGVDPSDSSRYPLASAPFLGGPSTRHLGPQSPQLDSSSHPSSQYASRQHHHDISDLDLPTTRTRRSALGNYTGADPDPFYAGLARRASRQRNSDGDTELPTYRSPSAYMRSRSLHRPPSYGDPSSSNSSGPQPPNYSSYSGPSAGHDGGRYPPSRRPSYWVERPADAFYDRDHFRRRG